MSSASVDAGGRAGSGRPPAPAWVHPTIFVVWMAIGIYWLVTFSGPYAWLSELQDEWFGAYSDLLSVSLPVIVGLTITEFVVSRLLGTRMIGRDENPIASLEGLKRLAPAAILVGGLAFAGMEYRKTADAGGLLAVTPADLSAHADRAGLYVRLSGTPDERMADDGEGNVYVALRDRGAGADDPVAALVAVRDDELAALLRGGAVAFTAQGMATHGVDGEMRRFFEQQGIRFADDPWVVRTWSTPQSMRKGVWVIIGITLFAAAFTFVRQWDEARQKPGA
jgi:hypothetical protein